MPPLVPRKRLRKSPPTESKPRLKATSVADRRKVTLYDDLDASATPLSKQSGSALQGLQDDDSDSSLSSLSDGEFEDVPQPKRQKVDESEEDDDIEFEDVAAPVPTADVPVPSGDLELTLNHDTRISLVNPFGEKKGPSKRDRKVRNATHCVHVLTLLWHNAVRNSWICHPEVQATMLSHLPPRLWDEVDRWRRNSGLVKDPEPKPSSKPQRKGKGKTKKTAEKDSRDWTSAAQRLEEGVPDMSHGDPLFRLMQSLVSWWKQRFRVRTPALRKWGYMSLERLDRVTKAYKTEALDAEQFGERIATLEDFFRCARKCQGSRDVGAQLFTALLRGLGLDARMVANLQSLGFGWNKLEDAEAEDDPESANTPTKQRKKPQKKETAKTPAKPVKKEKKGEPRKRSQPKRSSDTASVIVVDDTDDLELEYKDTDDESVVELESTPRRAPKPGKQFDQDLEYPHYWTEVLSPVTQKYLPVDPIVKGIVATSRELVESLEPRGAKADKARQIVAYIIGYSHDGTAKDVTVRYLKRQMLPGRTKGMRMPLEKVPIYNRHGKVQRYEMFDWFKTAMSGYCRGAKNHPLTETDEMEDSTDLKAAKVEKKEVKEGEETLQYYKQSKEFVLARHLKREEALKADAVAVKVFKMKGKGGKSEEEEDVFLRTDALNVKSTETWHKQGRVPRAGEQPLKRVPYRAATTNRRRELLEAEASSGHKVLQGLFSFEQTEWIIPPPIKDGVIPKNEYGNIDLFVEHMCPEGAVHVPYRGTMRVCKRLQIDYAEAVVDFEFGHRMAVPVIRGVVIAEEYHDQVMEELQKDEIERTRKEDEKRRKKALGGWRKFLMGMRIIERIRQDYGEIGNEVSVFGHSKGSTEPAAPPGADAGDEDMAGGFLPEGYEEEAEVEKPALHTSSNFFPVADEDDEDGENDLIMEDHRQEQDAAKTVSPFFADKGDERPGQSKTKTASGMKAGSSRPKRKAAQKTRSSRRRRLPVSEDEDIVEDAENDDDGSEDGWVNPDDSDA